MTALAKTPHPYNWTPTRTYTDSKYGVTFRMPPSWKPSSERLDEFDPEHNETHPMLLESNDPAPTVVFSDTAVPYAHTNITGLYFIYSAKPMADVKTCETFANSLSVDRDADLHQLTLNGIPFTARMSDDGDPNSRRGVNGTLYSTFRSGVCYLFETTATYYDRSNGAADDDYDWAKRNHIRPTPWNAVHAHLLDMMRTVRIPPVSAN